MTTRSIGRAATTPARGRLRVLRGLGLAAVSLLVPATAHVAAGGAVPVDLAFIVAAAGLAGACVALADRRRGLLEIGAVVLLSQPVMHAVLSWGGHHDPRLGGWGMIVAHIVAGIVVTAALAGAEAVLWAWWALRTTVLWTTAMWADVRCALASTVGGVRRPVPLSLDVPVPAPASLVLATAPRRGPPHLRMA